MDTAIQELGATPLRALVFLTALTFAPAIIMSTTAFLRIVLVLGFTRNALSLQQMPPNQVLIGLALFLTYFVMAGTIDQIYSEAVDPYLQGDIDERVMIERASGPIKKFMLEQTGDSELALMVNLSKVPVVGADDIPMRVVVPAFITSELRVAFSIGFLLFIPFLVIDIAIAALLNALGMIMLPPTVVALPFKIMIFVLGNGWSLVVGSVVRSFGGPS
ncbi:MAG: flagellar type III secretion system pore protein FliP [Myxococcales bacterium]|nr:flagellar type III secretion system pore protein FliP [Myxococcales bacterium]